MHVTLPQQALGHYVMHRRTVLYRRQRMNTCKPHGFRPLTTQSHYVNLSLETKTAACNLHVFTTSTTAPATITKVPTQNNPHYLLQHAGGGGGGGGGSIVHPKVKAWLPSHPWTHWNSSFASELCHCPEVLVSGVARHPHHSGVRLAQAEVLVDVRDTPRDILSSHLLCVRRVRKEEEGRVK